MPEVESIVPLKAAPKKPIQAPTEEQLVEQDPEASTRLSNNIGNKIVYGGAVGTLMLNSDGTYTIKNKDGIESIMYNQAPAFDGNLTFSQVGISPIKQKQSPFETIVINGENYTVKLIGLSSAEINGVVYKINWTTEGPGKAIASLSYRANDAEIAKLEIEKEIKKDFDEAFKGIGMLPKSSRFGVYMSYRYYSSLLKHIEKQTLNDLMNERFSIPTSLKSLLYAKSLIRHSINRL